MKKVTVNVKELIKIKNDLKKSGEAWDPLMTGIEACLLEEDWPRGLSIMQTLHRHNAVILNHHVD